MQLVLQDFATLVKTQASAVTASCRLLIDMTVGSALRALLEANASIGLWIQWLIIQVLAMTRAATSAGPDLDSWVADFGMARLPASAAVGQVQFNRATAGLPTVIPIGALVRTGTDPADQVFAVVADPSSPAWTGSGFQVAASALSIAVPVIAVQPGSAANVRAGSIVQLSSAIPGIDLVTNDSAFSGGLDAETDEALRLRFAGYLDSRNRATEQAVGFAIQSVRQGLSFTIAERVDASGAARAGHFTVTIDDGTGSPSPAIVASVASAIESIRPIGGSYSIRAPLILPVDVAIQLIGPSATSAIVQQAVTIYVSALAIGAPLVVSRVVQVVHEASPDVTSVVRVTVNGLAADVVPPIFGLVRPSTVLVTS